MPAGSVSHVGDFSWPTGVGPVPFLGVAAPAGWYMLKTGGAIEQVADFPTLAAMLGNRFGGDGIVTFGTPPAELFFRGPDGVHALWSIFGEDTHTLTLAESAPHSHGPAAGGFVTMDSNSGDNVTNTMTAGGNDDRHLHTDVQGGGQPHNNVPRTLVVNLIIKT